MIVGTEWLIEAFDCDPSRLRDVATLQAVFAAVIEDLGLKVLGHPHWHKFGGEGGITGLTMLTESHLACHTYPEFGTATFNLYCCEKRPEWNWQARLGEILDAGSVQVSHFVRGRNIGSERRDQRSSAVGGEV